MIELDTPYLTPKGDILKIYLEDYPLSPRDDYNVTKIVTDETFYRSPDENPFDTMLELLTELRKPGCNYVWDYVSRYEHGEVIYKRGRHDDWDSCTCGVIFAHKDDIREMYNVKKISRKVTDAIIERFDYDLEEYTNYVNGYVCRYEILNLNGDIIDDCHGFHLGVQDVLDYLGLHESELEQLDEIKEVKFRFEKKGVKTL